MKNFPVILLFSVLYLSPVPAQDIDIKNNSFYYPHVLQNWKTVYTLGLSSSSLPEDIVESDDDYRAPLVYFKLKMGLPLNTLVETALKSNWYTYHFHVGPKWTYEFGKFTMQAGADAAYFIGSMNSEGFKTKMTGWNIYPNICVGYLFPNFSVSLKSELILIADQTSKTGNVELTNDFRTFSGFSLSVYLEQPLWKDNFFVIGFKSSYASFYYPIWFTFPTFDRFFFIPEVMFSFNL